MILECHEFDRLTPIDSLLKFSELDEISNCKKCQIQNLEKTHDFEDIFD